MKKEYHKFDFKINGKQLDEMHPNLLKGFVKTADFTLELLHEDGALTLLANDGLELIGFLGIDTYDSAYCIEDINVLPCRRRKGVSCALFLAAYLTALKESLRRGSQISALTFRAVSPEIESMILKHFQWMCNNAQYKGSDIVLPLPNTAELKKMKFLNYDKIKEHILDT